MLRGSIRAAAAAAVVLLAPASAAAAGRAVTADPGLKPAFRQDTPDYVVRCRAGEPVRFAVSAPEGTSVAMGERDPRRGEFTAHVALAPGEAVRLRFRRASSTRTHHVRCLPSDFPGWQAKRHRRPQAAFYVLAPEDNRPVPRYAAVFDSRGVPLWWMRDDPPPLAAKLLPNGNLVWTQWVANDPTSESFEEHALDGRLVREHDTVGTEVNLHEFQRLPNGNSLMVTYPPRDGVDLSRWDGPSDATVLDAEIQEIDPAGRRVWRWNSKDHLAIAESRRWLPIVISQNRPLYLPDGRASYDLVHMNAVESLGDRLIFTARYEDAVYEIDRATGRVLWKLGGTRRPESLEIRGDPLAKRPFGGPHDARVLDGGRVVTVYDNGARRDRPPRAVAYRIDREKGTAKLIRTIRFKPARDSICCGSARALPGGNWVMAWGHTPWVTEHTPSGKRVLTIRFSDPKMMSYRAEPVLPGQLTRSRLRRGMDAMAAG